MFSGRPKLDPRERVQRRELRERLDRCAEGYEHVREAADESIEPIMQYLRHERSPYARRKRGD